MRNIVFDDHKPLIGAYYFFSGDFVKAEKELDILAGAGVNHLWLFIDDYFRKDNPAPREEFEFFLELLKKKGLCFIPVVGQFISLGEHPEVRIVVGDGTLSSDSRYWNMGCFRHPLNLEWASHEVRNFLQAYHRHELLGRINEKPLMSFVHEAYYRTDTPEMGGDEMRPNCYCSYCREAFIQYISTKYKDLAEYNKYHKESIKDWNDLRLPLGPEPDPMLWTEFMENHAEAIPEFLKNLIKVANEETPVLSVHECNDFYPGSWQTTLTGNNIWKMAAVTDIGHEDMYPLEFDQQYQIYIYGLLKDIMRSAMGFVHPYTGNGQAFTPWVIKAQLPKNSMTEQAYTSIIHGISGLIWWLGDDYELWKSMKKPNQFLAYWLTRLPEFQPEQPQIALLYSYTTMSLTQNDLHPMDLQLLYMALRQLGYAVDILTEEQMGKGILKEREYKLAIVPATSAMPKRTRDALMSFVTNGGNLLMDYAEEYWPDEFPLLVNFNTKKSGRKPRFYRTLPDLALTGGELFIPVESSITGVPLFDSGSNSRIWAEYDSGDPAVVSWKVGEGKIIGAGSIMGIDFSNYLGFIHLNKMFPFLIRMNDDARKLLGFIINNCGVRPSVVSSEPAVELGAFHRDDGSRVCFAVNHRPETLKCCLTFERGKEIKKASNSLLKVEDVSGGLRVKLELQGLGGAWLEIV